jgi:hypothetical protein
MTPWNKYATKALRKAGLRRSQVKYQNTHRAKLNKWCQEWRLAHKDQVKAQAKRYYQKHRKRCILASTHYQKQHPNYWKEYYHSHRLGAYKRNLKFFLKKFDLSTIPESFRRIRIAFRPRPNITSPTRFRKYYVENTDRAQLSHLKYLLKKFKMVPVNKTIGRKAYITPFSKRYSKCIGKDLIIY